MYQSNLVERGKNAPPTFVWLPSRRIKSTIELLLHAYSYLSKKINFTRQDSGIDPVDKHLENHDHPNPNQKPPDQKAINYILFEAQLRTSQKYLVKINM